ncbi:Septum formation initiator [Thioalkalivibrio nitratireducens DSM 14787]|uniref:Cell division protein FtsB n=1 Tax=Thioalkalivibrio nitratireducens (strain DSM 14787 / UNIQEM 213 / ALEN2) TaxID=1255043 RepID=L0DWX4_THIND|nr:Septum formation initiator [Thioalkalivibrio nitratireducens DSM 14787]
MGLLFLALLALQWPLWFSEGGWRDVRELRDVKRLQEAENERLRARNRALEAEVDDLRSGTEAVEERARRDLGMIREDETFFFLIGSEVAPGAPAGNHGD